jgi:endonuclease/exonuclease/phosphatase family metal-dependent hydrolase
VASFNLHHGVSSTGTPFNVTAALCQLDATIICVQETPRPSGGDGKDDMDRGDTQASGNNTAAADGADRDSGDRADGADRDSGDRADGADRDSGDRADGADRDSGDRAGRQSAVSDQLSDAAAKLGMSLHRAGNDGPLGEFAIAVLTTLPVAGYEVVELGTAPGDFIPRRAQIVLLQLPDGRRLRLVNTHLTHRFTSPVQLLRLQRRLKPGLPTIIVGDLNMPRTIAARWPGYADLIRGRTFPAERPLLQLDHVLASRGIEPVGGTVLPPAGSDHLPVRAEIRISAGTLRNS